MRMLWSLIFATCWSASSCAEAETLAQRFSRLSCSIVHIQAGNELGTGVFIDDSGALLTAAHVVSERYCTNDSASCGLVVRLRTPIRITFSDGRTQTIAPPIPNDQQKGDALYDLIRLATGVQPKCHIGVSPEGKQPVVGDSLIAIGFPGFSSAPVLYQGFLSADKVNDPSRLPMTDEKMSSIIGVHDTSRNVMRIQIPITAGVSGSPIIDDSDDVVAITVENPIPEIADLTNLVKTQLQSKPGANIMIGGVDTNKTLAEIAFILTNFVSSGAGYAVPVSYLAK